MKLRQPFVLLTLLNVLVALFAGCGGEGDAGSGDMARTVERYMQAKVERDETTIRGLLCSEMESVVDREIHTFDSVSDVRLEGVACQADPDGTNVVLCDGRIVATYGAEDTEFPLVAYRVVQEDGEWKWCGEAAQ